MLQRLNKQFHWQPDPEEFVAPLRTSALFEFSLETFPAGIDNSRIDVALNETFMEQARLFVRHGLSQVIRGKRWGKSYQSTDASMRQSIRDSYVGMMDVAMDQVRKHSSIEPVQLLQLAVVKFLLHAVAQEFELYRGQLQQARGASKQQSTGHAVELHERLIALVKEGPALRYQVIRKFLREILKLEDMRLSKLRKSMLDMAWPLPRDALANPILQIPTLWADELMMHHYTLACTDREDEALFGQVNGLLAGLFMDYLPNWAWPNEEGGGADDAVAKERRQSAAIKQSADESVLNTFWECDHMLSGALQREEYEQGLSCWLDVPENMQRVLYSAEPRKSLRLDVEEIHVRQFWRQSHWPGFHHRLLRQIFRRFRANGLERKIIAAHLAPAVYKELHGQVPVRLISQYLSGKLTRKRMQRRLRGMALQTMHVSKVLDQASRVSRHMPVARRRYLILRFLQQFVTLRRDLKLAYRTYWAMNRIHLVSRPEDLALSRNNGMLQDFSAQARPQSGQHRICSHVVLKADVRGSTEMIAQLRKRNLNPASHFSLNFFEPINKLLARYGARKVFVEGDAVILAIYEYEDTPYQMLCVSHACGLAQEILKVIDAKNVKSRENGLPELELGLGISFVDQAPTFLYDDGREIMISPAINTADTLSSCSAMLRKSAFAKDLRRGIEVVVPAGPNVPDKSGGTRMLRYNVNGIELDTPAFMKLQSELMLKRVELEEGIYTSGSRFYSGRYPDVSGKMHLVVVREAPVRVWEGGAPGTGEQHGQRFYQVITDSAVLEKIEQHQPTVSLLRPGADNASASAVPTKPRYLY